MSEAKPTEEQLLTLLKQYGITGTSAAIQIVSAWRNWDDINGDIALFNQELKRYEQLSEFMKTLEKNKNDVVEFLDYQTYILKQREQYQHYLPDNIFSNDTFRNNNLTLQSLLEQKNGVVKEFEELQKKFDSAKKIELQKDGLLKRSQIYEILGLVVTWIDIFQGYYELKNNGKDLNQYYDELKRIEVDYILPVFEKLKNESKIDGQKIECAMMQLRLLQTPLKKQKEIAKQAAAKHIVGAISNGFAVASSIAKIIALGTNSWASILQWGIGTLQGAAVVVHSGLAICAGQNYYAYKDLIDKISNKYQILSKLKDEMNNL